MTDIEVINDQLRKRNYPFRVTLYIRSGIIGYAASFVSYICPLNGWELYIDDNLERYIRHRNKFYKCTNADLLTQVKDPADREAFVMELSGITIF